MNHTFTRRDWLKTTAAGALLAGFPCGTRCGDAADGSDLYFYVGTYTSGNSRGIYIYRLNRETGEMMEAAPATRSTNPSFLAIDPRMRFLFAANETSQFEGKPTGSVSAFAIDPQSKGLTLLNQQSSHGSSPCYVTVDRTGRWVLVANYSSGNAAVYPVRDDGTLEPASCVVQHEGSSVNPQRQKEPHTHSILLDPGNRFAFAADLGIDKVMIYRFDSQAGKLEPASQPWAQAKPGSGPRHFAFHPNGKLAFLIQEISSTMTSFAYDPEKGSLKEIQTVSTLPADFTATNSCADVHVHPSGKFLYGSNRGHNSIVIFALDRDAGTMTVVGHESTQGKTPRNFALDPSGTFLLAANQDSGSVVSFRIDSDTGKLQPTGFTAVIPNPVCVKFLTGNSEQHSSTFPLPLDKG